VQRNDHVGYVVEAKKSLPSNTDHWHSVVEQLEKYDDALVGWWTDDETITKPCVALLLEIARSADFCRFLDTLRDRNELSFNGSVSVVEFTRSPNTREFLFLRLHWGNIEDASVASALESGKKVPIEDVIASFGEKKFYDSRPITEHTMSILWQNLFTDMKSGVGYDESVGAWPLDVNLHELTEELQRLYGSSGGDHREVSYPRMEWTRTAMEALVKLGFAVPSDDRQAYTVFFKRITGDIIERFAKHREPQRQTPEVSQLPLFETDSPKEA
jgi:hypothetical protein